MATLVLAAFEDPVRADEALRELEDVGYMADEVSVISSEDVAAESRKDTKDTTRAAGAGAIIGGLAGLLATVVAFPAVTGLIIGGPIIALLGLTGAATGAVAGGLIGALTNLGLPKEKAADYSDVVDQGGVIIGLSGQAEINDEARGILDRHGARQVDVVDLGEAPASSETPGRAGKPLPGRQEPAFGEQRETNEDQDTRG